MPRSTDAGGPWRLARRHVGGERCLRPPLRSSGAPSRLHQLRSLAVRHLDAAGLDRDVAAALYLDVQLLMTYVDSADRLAGRSGDSPDDRQPAESRRPDRHLAVVRTYVDGQDPGGPVDHQSKDRKAIKVHQRRVLASPTRPEAPSGARPDGERGIGVWWPRGLGLLAGSHAPYEGYTLGPAAPGGVGLAVDQLVAVGGAFAEAHRTAARVWAAAHRGPVPGVAVPAVPGCGHG